MDRMPGILTVVGARPQFIKAAPVSRALAELGIQEWVVHTGQHYDREMSAVFFEELQMRLPDTELNVGSGTHAEQTAAMLVGLERTIAGRGPDWVLIYGDTNSTLAGALAAAKLRVPVAHVESGLRSFNREMPEEVNRIVADSLASALFIPTEAARQNLSREGTPEERVLWTGDVMYDVALAFKPAAMAKSQILEKLGLEEKNYVLATLHRAENTDNEGRLRAALEGLARAAQDVPVVLPMHPRTTKMLSKLPVDLGGIRVIAPVGFLDMVRLEAGAGLIATDSGGVQKEAFFHRVPCVTLRDETEWVELVDLGWNRICPPLCAEEVARTILAAIGTRGAEGQPYGDGHAAKRIAGFLQHAPRKTRARPSARSQT
jgi:UDP-GlcNAc3NAcA epimerase